MIRPCSACPEVTSFGHKGGLERPLTYSRDKRDCLACRAFAWRFWGFAVILRYPASILPSEGEEAMACAARTAFTG